MWRSNNHKYGAVKRLCSSNHKHDSLKEQRRCDELSLLEKHKVIKDLKVQVKFIIQEKFKYNGKTEREISYYADFTYFDNQINKQVIEDVKGYKTAVYKIKRKMLLNTIKDRDIAFLET